MGVSSSMGQLMRAGIQKAPFQKRKKKKKISASKAIRESVMGAFSERGQDEISKPTRKKGRTYLVTIIEEGMGNSKDKNFYSGESLQTGAQLFNGAKAYADHPDAIKEKTLPERSMKELVGWYSDCAVDKNPETGKARLRGKLHFFPPAKWLTDMIDTILTEPSAKGLFGISINAIGKTRPAQMNGDVVNYVESFQRVDSADVVTEPAARGKFEKILESKSGASSRVVTRNGRRRMREALATKDLKEVADGLVAAYNSDSPDEMKEALYEASQKIYAATSISGKGPGQANEEQYSNINPSGGMATMKTSKRRVKAAVGPDFRLKRKKRFQAAAGTHADSETYPEPSPEDIPSHLDEADVEDEEGDTDLGDVEEFGDPSKHKTNESRMGRRRPVRRLSVQEDEDEGIEGLEDEGLEDEGMEDEGFEDEQAPMGGVAAPTGGGAPGSSRMVTADGDEDEFPDEEDDMGGELGEAEEEGEEVEEGEEDLSIPEPQLKQRQMMASKRRRKAKEASFSGGLGKSGSSSLTPQADPTKGYDPPDEEHGGADDSTSAVGKSYKIKTSRFSRNKPSHRLARKIITEANRRIFKLEDRIARLRESNRSKERMIGRYQGIIRFHNTKISARRFLESAVEKEILPEGYARTLAPKLFGLSEKEQVREIKYHARLLESTQGAVEERLMENVDGVGARGGAVSSLRSTADGNSPLIEAMTNDGIPFKEDDE